MVFGIEKCKTSSIAKGKLKMRNFTTEDDDTMQAMNTDEIYRYLGHTICIFVYLETNIIAHLTIFEIIRVT